MSTNSSRWLAVIFAAVVIALSSLPGPSLPDLGGFSLDKVLHFSQYAVLGYLVTRGWGPGRDPGSSSTGSWLLGILLLCFAALDEFHQKWIPGRSVELLDWLADACGVTTSFFIAIWVNRHRNKTGR